MPPTAMACTHPDLLTTGNRALHPLLCKEANLLVSLEGINAENDYWTELAANANESIAEARASNRVYQKNGNRDQTDGYWKRAIDLKKRYAEAIYSLEPLRDAKRRSEADIDAHRAGMASVLGEWSLDETTWVKSACLLESRLRHAAKGYEGACQAARDLLQRSVRLQYSERRGRGPHDLQFAIERAIERARNTMLEQRAIAREHSDAIEKLTHERVNGYAP